MKIENCKCGYPKTELNKGNHAYCQFIPDELAEELTRLRSENTDLKNRIKVLEERHKNGRWDIEEYEDGSIGICRGEHEKSHGCLFVRYIPQVRVRELEEERAILKSQIENSEATWEQQRLCTERERKRADKAEAALSSAKREETWRGLDVEAGGPTVEAIKAEEGQ